jgi:hypothetical protein
MSCSPVTTACAVNSAKPSISAIFSKFNAKISLNKQDLSIIMMVLVLPQLKNFMKTVFVKFQKFMH